MVTVSGWPLSWFVKRPNIPSPFFIVSFLRYHGEINVFSQLTLAPVLPAIAAGNCVLIKPSEVSSLLFFSEIELGQIIQNVQQK